MMHPPARRTTPVRARLRTLVGSLVAAVLALVLLLASGGAVQAATRVFTDPDDSPTIDIRTVHVSYRDWLRVRVEHDGRVKTGQVYAFWIDTRPHHAGPEYYAAFRADAEVPPLQRVSGFGDRTKTPTSCHRIDAGASAGQPEGDVTFRVAGRCLGDPHRVRISVHFVKPDGSSADWAPGFRRLYPWVHRH